MYLAYFLVMLVTLTYRSEGWPKVAGQFALGRWGLVGEHRRRDRAPA